MAHNRSIMYENIVCIVPCRRGQSAFVCRSHVTSRDVGPRPQFLWGLTSFWIVTFVMWQGVFLVNFKCQYPIRKTVCLEPEDWRRAWVGVRHQASHWRDFTQASRKARERSQCRNTVAQGRQSYFFYRSVNLIYRAIKSKYRAINGKVVRSHVISCHARCFPWTRRQWLQQLESTFLIGLALQKWHLEIYEPAM